MYISVCDKCGLKRDGIRSNEINHFEATYGGRYNEKHKPVEFDLCEQCVKSLISVIEKWKEGDK